jgi:mRNA interferase YafQ
MYKIKTTNRFEKDAVKCIKRKYNFSLLEKVVDLLEIEGKLPPKYKSHILSGNFDDCWECHIRPDWLLIWQQNNDEKIIVLIATGTHSDLF